MKILSFYNIKGGVGKTASSVNIAYLCAMEGFKTLLCDLDPQGSSSYYFRVKPKNKYNSKKLLKGFKKIEGNIRGTDFDNLDLLPSDITYRNLDIMIKELNGSNDTLKKILSPLGDKYDYIILDAPPNITLFSENIFNASDYIFVPVIPTTLSILTYKKLIEFFIDNSLPKEKIYPFFSMVEKKKNLHKLIMNDKEITSSFLQSFVPYLSDIERMGIYRNPINFEKPSSIASKAYKNLWAKIKNITEVKK